MNTIRGLLLAAALSLPLVAAPAEKVTVYKTATCGCCGKWVEHLRSSGFTVDVKEVASTAETRKQLGVPDKLASCHTAKVGNYAVEGHVPAADIERMLKTKPKGAGIAVPGMPLGSPGMEQGPRKQAYSVWLFQSDGTVSQFGSYPGN